MFIWYSSLLRLQGLYSTSIASPETSAFGLTRQYRTDKNLLVWESADMLWEVSHS
jgi:hypothetical protein